MVPRTAERVRACVAGVRMPPDQLMGMERVRGLAVTAEKLAINAVMAGCLPMHFPVVVTAWMATMQEDFLMHGATASTGGCAGLVVLNGPVPPQPAAPRPLHTPCNTHLPPPPIAPPNRP